MLKIILVETVHNINHETPLRTISRTCKTNFGILLQQKFFAQLEKLLIRYAIIFPKVSKIKLAEFVIVKEEALWAGASLRFRSRQASVTDTKIANRAGFDDLERPSSP